MTAWHSWFPGRDPDKIGEAEIWAEAGRRALKEVDAQIGWLPTGTVIDLPDGTRTEGHAERVGTRRRIYAPTPDCVPSLAVLLHECGHHATDFRGDTVLEQEISATDWALRHWQDWGLDYLPNAEFSLGRWFRTYVRRGLNAGDLKLDEVRALIPEHLREALDLRPFEPKPELVP